ncbi:ANK-REP-REGION domain-containing protein [Mycena venus]|uniref:ANK-REP-REGION domain-containing protein n=1 Tax=Mycena venus TaxID=2733690 RepID=A0A8H6YQ42_9AGAR|nr:ANK-REP-REGION domain-containing protein [Mycena venus]
MPPKASESHTVNQYISGGSGGSGGPGGEHGGGGGSGEGPSITYGIKTQQVTINHHGIQPHPAAERNQIIEWLSPINFFLRHADISRARQAGTGGWLLADPLFKQWESGSGRTLWCRGIPGAGKTVLASKVVDHLNTDCKNKKIGVACIYLNHKEADEQTPSKLLAGLWRQLVLDKDIGTAAKKLYQGHSEKHTSPSLDEVVHVLRSSFGEFSKVYIIVDAIDEYPEVHRRILLERLAAIGPTVNLMVTSRPHLTPDASLRNLRALEIRANDDDVRKYIDAQIQLSPRLLEHIQSRPKLRRDIHSKINSHTVDGMFLLAKLHIESLSTKNAIKTVRETLTDLPKNLHENYDVVMQRIESQNEEDRKTARSALIWVANAKRPLKVSELIVALAIEPGARRLNPANIGGVLWYASSTTLHRNIWTVFRPSGFPDAQTEITRTLLTFLAFDGFPSSLHPRRAQGFAFGPARRRQPELPPLLEYSQYCLEHAAGQPEGQLRSEIAEFLGRAVRWKQAMEFTWSLPLWSYPWPSQPTPLWIAAAANLLDTAKFLLEGVPLRKHPNSAATIAVALDWGHSKMVELLLENGASVNQWCEPYRAPLVVVASHFGLENIVRLLISHGADLSAQGLGYGTALADASYSGRESIVKLLLENGADVNLRDKKYGSAIKAASQRGYKSIVQLLIRHGAKTGVESSGLESGKGEFIDGEGECSESEWSEGEFTDEESSASEWSEREFADGRFTYEERVRDLRMKVQQNLQQSRMMGVGRQAAGHKQKQKTGTETFEFADIRLNVRSVGACARYGQYDPCQMQITCRYGAATTYSPSDLLAPVFDSGG